MKIRDMLGLVLFGFLLHHIEDMIELLKTIIANIQAESATMQQARISEVMSQLKPEDDDIVIRGFCDNNINENEIIVTE